MGYPVYYVEAGDTLPHLFDTFDGGDGSSITMSGLAVTDIEIYKDGSVTQRSSDAGYTLLDTDGIDFDSITGIHGFSIDLSDNTDAGFYAVGSWYHVVISSITVDSQTVSFVACAFRIVSATRGMAGTALPDAAADAAGGLPISDAGGLDLDSQIGTDIDAILVDTAEIGAAGAGLTEAGGTGDQLTAINLPDQTMNITGNITGNLSGSVGSVTGAVGSVTAEVSADVVKLNSVAQSLVDLVDFVDTGYDPATHKVAGVVLTDTCTTNTDLVSAADIKTALEADGGDLSSLMEALVNKLVIEEATGTAEMFNDAGVSQGTVAAAFTTDGTYTTRLRMLK